MVESIKGFVVKEMFSSISGLPGIIVKDIGDLSPLGFDIKGTFESGQCFRWDPAGEDRYKGIVRGKAVFAHCRDRRHLEIENTTVEDFKNIWYDYFDLATDYTPIIRSLKSDRYMKESIDFSGGVRMLVQDFEETLFSFILSSQNNIPRIKNLVKSLCESYGSEINLYIPAEKRTFKYFAFPSSKKLATCFCNVEREEKCTVKSLCMSPFGGYRCPYIKNTAIMLSTGIYIPDFKKLSEESDDYARKHLQKLSGVGEKVADCVLLYSGIRKDICPIDTWVEKTIKSVYLNPKASKKDIRSFVRGKFGEHAGYAQLWFFNYERTVAKQKP